MHRWSILICIPCTFTLGCRDEVRCSEEIQNARAALNPDKTNLTKAREWQSKAAKTCGQDVRISALKSEIGERAKSLELAEERSRQQQAAQAGDDALKEAARSWNNLGILTDVSTDVESGKGNEGLAEMQLDKTRKQTDKLTKGLDAKQAARVSAYNQEQYERYSKKIAKQK